MPEKREKLKFIELRARSLGFDALGVAPPEPAQFGKWFVEWLDRGYAGEMGYLERGAAKRLDPDQVLPGVRSILCLRTNYYTRPRTLDFLEQVGDGDISAYAWNEDYHDLIDRRLQKLEACLSEEFPGCKTRRYVDTGPVLEKPLAQRAGLGWIGKHTNLLTQGVGSWYFLSEILTDLDLPFSTEAEDHCGTCTACIDICPTRAIVAPYVLDARRCISYLTIELKGPIPLEYRKAIANRIFGCDDCQIVCPWNGYAQTTEEPSFRERAGTRRLIELMQLDDEHFRNRFRKSPVKRIKRRGLLRNVAVALGNSGDSGAVPVLVAALSDPEPLVRGHAWWALGQLIGKQALEMGLAARAKEQDPEVLAEIDRLKTY